jgi:hypothetical protein
VPRSHYTACFRNTYKLAYSKITKWKHILLSNSRFRAEVYLMAAKKKTVKKKTVKKKTVKKTVKKPAKKTAKKKTAKKK